MQPASADSAQDLVPPRTALVGRLSQPWHSLLDHRVLLPGRIDIVGRDLREGVQPVHGTGHLQVWVALNALLADVPWLEEVGVRRKELGDLGLGPFPRFGEGIRRGQGACSLFGWWDS